MDDVPARQRPQGEHQQPMEGHEAQADVGRIAERGAQRGDVRAVLVMALVHQPEQRLDLPGSASAGHDNFCGSS